MNSALPHRTFVDYLLFDRTAHEKHPLITLDDISFLLELEQYLNLRILQEQIRIQRRVDDFIEQQNYVHFLRLFNCTRALPQNSKINRYINARVISRFHRPSPF